MQTDQVLELMQRVAAEVITPRFRSLAADEIHEKNPGDLVTVADREAEAVLAAALQAAYPEALIVGEEATAADPGLVARLADADHAWLIDPVDGTRNFVAGSPDHAVMLAEVRGGETVRGWIWQPEHGQAFVAERGAGVWRNGERLIRPAPAAELTCRTGGTSRRTVGRQLGDGVGRVVPTAWCCGVDYPHLLTGKLDWLVFGPPKPWDHAPGGLMVTEAGGVVGFPDGRPYRPALTGELLLAAADEASADALAARLR